MTEAFSWGYPAHFLDDKLRHAVYDFLQTGPVETKETQELRRLLGEWKPPLTFKDLKQGERFTYVTAVDRSEMMKIESVGNYNAVYLTKYAGMPTIVQIDTKVVRL